jgi:hypothetical protein
VSGTGNIWVNNSTLPGWYSSETVYHAGTGSSQSGAQYSFGAEATHPVSERALGSLVSSGTGTIYYGIRLKNSTCNDLTSFEIAYAGEQWRKANTSFQKLEFQYQVNATGITGGTWTDLDSLDFTGPQTSGTPATLDGNDSTNRAHLAATLSTIILPPGQEIWFRWMDANDAGNDHGLAIDDVSITANGPVCFFRSATSGDWNDTATWEQSDDSSTWISATVAPSHVNGKIRVARHDTITISSPITFDQLMIDSGAVLMYGYDAGSSITVNDGAGADLIINGEFQDRSQNPVTWNGSASWKMGSSGTLIRTRNTASVNWRDTYSGGIAAIPSTANWIIRKTGPENPSLTGTSMTYPNLIIENFSGSEWNTGAGSIFTGSSDFPHIKGSLDIGGSGTDGVNFLNNNTNASPVLVSGNVTIRSGSTLRDYGTGFEILGDLTVDGKIIYASGTGSRKLVFSGNEPQTINGSGVININDLSINKSGNDLTLNRSLSVDGLLTFVNGIIYSSSENLLIINSAGSVSGANDLSYVNGPVRYTGLNEFIFPVGKEGDYQPLSMSYSTGLSDFTCEYFHDNPRDAFNDSLGFGLDHISACEYWTVDRNVGSASKNISAEWDENSCGVTVLPDLRVARWNGSVWQNEGNTGITGTTLSGSVMSGVVSEFSPFTLASSSPSNPLPAELLYFTGGFNGENVDLNWATASEMNSDFFAVERSSEGLSFSELTRIQSAGYSTSLNEYSAVDTDPLPGLSYYRLRLVDIDGELKYSGVLFINTKGAGELTIGNIFSEDGMLYFQINSKPGSRISLEIIDIAGRKIVVSEEEPENTHQQYTVPEALLSNGIYLLKAGDGKTMNMKKFVK